jgi:Helix-turn-helix domain
VNAAEPKHVALPDRGRRYRWVTAVMRDASIGFASKAVAWCLASHQNQKDYRCFPAAQTIAEEVGASLRGVQKALGELEATGWIEIERGDGQSRGGRRSNSYRLVFPSFANNVRNSDAETFANGAHEITNGVPDFCERRSQESCSELKIEPCKPRQSSAASETLDDDDRAVERLLGKLRAAFDTGYVRSWIESAHPRITAEGFELLPASKLAWERIESRRT